MTKLTAALDASDIINDCEGAWESLLPIAAKPHQESCTDIHAFI